jgi:hypothetical protein
MSPISVIGIFDSLPYKGESSGNDYFVNCGVKKKFDGLLG